MRSVRVTTASAVAILAVVSVSANAQEAAEPGAEQLPPVEVIQQQPAPAPAAKKKSAAKKQVSPSPQGPTASAPSGAPTGSGPERGPDGRVVGNAPNINPISPATGILPTDLQNYAGSATRVSTEEIEEDRPKDIHEALTRVPGVVVVQDDGMARHANIGIRGGQPRRSRKVLMMEDGFPINFSTYLDPSTHYTPPIHRLESVEVLRGAVVAHGPLNNHGVINFRNLSPFGLDQTVISAAIGHTEGINKDVGNYRHFHTRQNAGNVGVVASYTGSEAGGAWDNEVLRYNDFYGALGWRDSQQDLVVSGGYFRQRDNYDEYNWMQSDAALFANGRRKSQNSTPGAWDGNRGLHNDNNTYNADLYRIQAAHNWYIDSNTTLTTRVYHNEQERNRFENRRGGGATDNYVGRERLYAFSGADSRIEFANIGLFGQVTADLQAGVRYEHHSVRNCNTTAPAAGVVLGPRQSGVCAPNNLQKFEADAFAGFIQTAINVTSDLTITPGVRFESYDIDRRQIGANATSDHDAVLPGIAFAWEAMPRSTVYGGYHKGITPHVVRNAAAPAWPLPDEEGDNYEIGVRSTAVKGLTFDLAYFYSEIENFQIKSPVTLGDGNLVFGAVDEVEIQGFEAYTRLDTQPFIGGFLNFFGEATYTFTDGVITESQIAAEVGNLIPEVPRHYANLTLGVEEKGLWDASVTWTYIGGFFVDTLNTPAGSTTPPVLLGDVDDVWLLSARANYHIPNSGMTLFVSGQNLENKFYIADRNDGAKPGFARTLWAGFTLKLDD